MVESFLLRKVYQIIAVMTPKENCIENLRKSISGIFGKKYPLQCSAHCELAVQIAASNFKYYR